MRRYHPRLDPAPRRLRHRAASRPKRRRCNRRDRRASRAASHRASPRSELVGHFGNPALQVREGTSLKLQFRGRSCVLDAYLYPPEQHVLRVTHVDTRDAVGRRLSIRRPASPSLE